MSKKPLALHDLIAALQSLPDDFQQVIRLAQDQYKITVAPLQISVGGWSGAIVYLASVSSNEIRRVEPCILKLDRGGKFAKSDEITRHNTAIDKAPPGFARKYIADLVFDRTEFEGAIAIFYRLAGQSLLRSLSRSLERVQSRSFHPRETRAPRGFKKTIQV